MERFVIFSADGHAGADIETYRPYLEVCPTCTVHGLHSARTVKVCVGAGAGAGGGGGGGGGGAGGGGGGGAAITSFGPPNEKRTPKRMLWLLLS